MLALRSRYRKLKTRKMVFAPAIAIFPINSRGARKIFEVGKEMRPLRSLGSQRSHFSVMDYRNVLQGAVGAASDEVEACHQVGQLVDFVGDELEPACN